MIKKHLSLLTFAFIALAGSFIYYECSSDDDFSSLSSEDLSIDAQIALTMGASDDTQFATDDPAPVETDACAAWALANLMYINPNVILKNSYDETITKTPGSCYYAIKQALYSSNLANLKNHQLISLSQGFGMPLTEIQIPQTTVATDKASAIENALKAISKTKNFIVQKENHTYIVLSYTSSKKKIKGTNKYYTDYSFTCLDYSSSNNKIYNKDIIAFLY